MGKEITDEINIDSMMPDETTRPKFAMYRLVAELIGKVGLYDLADMIYKIHARCKAAQHNCQYYSLSVGSIRLFRPQAIHQARAICVR